MGLALDWLGFGDNCEERISSFVLNRFRFLPLKVLYLGVRLRLTCSESSLPRLTIMLIKY